MTRQTLRTNSQCPGYLCMTCCLIDHLCTYAHIGMHPRASKVNAVPHAPARAHTQSRRCTLTHNRAHASSHAPTQSTRALTLAPAPPFAMRTLRYASDARA
eukprot:3754082-Pleurochrysis_carterae.AAC.4